MGEYADLKNKITELVSQREELRDEVSPLKKRLSLAIMAPRRSDAKATADLSSKVSFLDAEARRISIEIGQAERRMGEIRRENGHIENINNMALRKDWHRTFTMVAKEILPTDQFIRISQITDIRNRTGAGEVKP